MVYSAQGMVLFAYSNSWRKVQQGVRRERHGTGAHWMKKNLTVRTSPATAQPPASVPGAHKVTRARPAGVRCHRGSLRTPHRSQSFLSLPRAFVSSARRQALHMGVEQSWKLHHFHYIGVGCRAGLAGEAMGEGDGVATGEIAAKTCASKRSMASRRSGWCLFTSRCLFTAERTPLTAAERPGEMDPRHPRADVSRVPCALLSC